MERGEEPLIISGAELAAMRRRARKPVLRWRTQKRRH
jgi:hypothetical protein